MISILINYIEKLTNIIGHIAAWLLIPLTLVAVYEVAARYLFHAPTIWAFEIGYMLMGAYFLLGAAYALHEGAHIRIDVFYTHFKPKNQRTINFICYLFLFRPISWWLTYALWNYAAEAFITGETTGQSAWNPPVWPFRLTFFIGFFLLSLQATAEFLKLIIPAYPHKVNEKEKSKAS